MDSKSRNTHSLESHGQAGQSAHMLPRALRQKDMMQFGQFEPVFRRQPLCPLPAVEQVAKVFRDQHEGGRISGTAIAQDIE